MSSRSLLKSSVSLRRSCSNRFILSSRRPSCSTSCLVSFSVAFADWASVSAARIHLSATLGKKKKRGQRTEWHVVIAFDGHILGLLYVVDGFQYGQAMAHAVDAHGLEVIVLEGNQGLSDDVVFCRPC